MRFLKFTLFFILVVGGVFSFASADQSLPALVPDDFSAYQVGESGGLEGDPDSGRDPAFVEYNPLSSRLGLQSSSSLMSVAPIEPADDGSLKSLLLSFIGSYDPIVLEHEYTSGNGYTSVLREVQIDYPWLAACALLIVIMYCFFRTLGNIFGGSRK